MKAIDIYEPLPGGMVRVRGLTEWEPLTAGEPVDWDISRMVCEIYDMEWEHVEDAEGTYTIDVGCGDRGISVRAVFAGVDCEVFTPDGICHWPDNGGTFFRMHDMSKLTKEQRDAWGYIPKTIVTHDNARAKARYEKGRAAR